MDGKNFDHNQTFLTFGSCHFEKSCTPQTTLKRINIIINNKYINNPEKKTLNKLTEVLILFVQFIIYL